jgi:hypothetical protein
MHRYTALALVSVAVLLAMWGTLISATLNVLRTRRLFAISAILGAIANALLATMVNTLASNRMYYTSSIDRTDR